MADTLKDSVHIVKDFVGTDVTAPTPVSLVTSLACLSLLASRGTLEKLEKDRELLVITAENFHGYVRGKDAKCPMLRKNLGYAVAEADKTYSYSKESHELALTQQDEVKSIFPAHLVMLDAATGQTLMDQMFDMPKIVDLNYMSIPSLRRHTSKEEGHCRTAWRIAQKQC